VYGQCGLCPVLGSLLDVDLARQEQLRNYILPSNARTEENQAFLSCSLSLGRFLCVCVRVRVRVRVCVCVCVK
jgi:hypothetical protein